MPMSQNANVTSANGKYRIIIMVRYVLNLNSMRYWNSKVIK